MDKKAVVATVQEVLRHLDALVVLGSERHRLVQIERMLAGIAEEVVREAVEEKEEDNG